MQTNTAAEYLIRKIEENIGSATRAIVSGIVDMNEYRRLVGVIQGLESAKELIKELAKQVEENDE
jgi:translation initiation factor 1 (eIF-1/SUI1)